MAPSVVARQQPIEAGHEVVLAAGSKLHDHHAGGGVRDEHVEHAVTAGGDIGQESLAGIGQVVDASASGRLDADFAGIHTPSLAPGIMPPDVGPSAGVPW